MTTTLRASRWLLLCMLLSTAAATAPNGTMASLALAAAGAKSSGQPSRARVRGRASETMAILILDGWKRHMGPMIAAAAATSFRGACTSVAGITKEKWNSPQAPFNLKWLNSCSMESLSSARILSVVFEIVFCLIHRFYSFLQAASCTLLNFRHARLQPPLFDRCHHHRVGRKNGRRRAPVNIARFVGRRARRRNCFRDDYDVEIVCPSVRPCAAVFSFLPSFHPHSSDVRPRPFDLSGGALPMAKLEGQ